jgi:hypothetical protein
MKDHTQAQTTGTAVYRFAKCQPPHALAERGRQRDEFEELRDGRLDAFAVQQAHAHVERFVLQTANLAADRAQVRLKVSQTVCAWLKKKIMWKKLVWKKRNAENWPWKDQTSQTRQS